MNNETRTLITYRLDRARESLVEARLLLEQGHVNTFVNRLYYACFYAVSALVLCRDFSTSEHSGLRSFFHQTFVKTGIISAELGKIYDKLYDNRQKGDYADLVKFEKEQVLSWFKEAEAFVAAVEGILVKEGIISA
jgi:uncharacterized protein